MPSATDPGFRARKLQSWTAGGIHVVGLTVAGRHLELLLCRAFDAGERVYWCGNASNGGTLKP
jgi:hypothetical protein